MNYLRFFTLCFFVLIGVKNNAQVTEQNYRIYSVKAAKEIAIAEIVEDMKNADVLFYGEEHNDSVTHYLEAKIFETLYQNYNSNLALSMEMFERDVQPIMNEYLTSDVREKNFRKDARVWSNYKDYRPMVEFCKINKLDVVCANAAGRYSNLAGRKGQKGLMDLPHDSKKYFAPLPYDTAAGKYHEKLVGLFEKESPKKKNQSSMTESFSLVMAQSLWDATMAFSIGEYFERNPSKKIFQVNGRFHSDEGFAVVTQLKKYNPKARILIISSGSDKSFPNIDWKKFENQGDYIIITDPKVPKTYKD